MRVSGRGGGGCPAANRSEGVEQHHGKAGPASEEPELLERMEAQAGRVVANHMNGLLCDKAFVVS